MSSSPIKASTPPNGVEKKMPFMIGVAGGTASGKSTVCEKIMEAVIGSAEAGGVSQNIISLSQDSFYRELSEKEGLQAARGLFNFDHPDAFDHDLMLSCLGDIREGKMTKVPVYDFKTNSRVKDKHTVIQPSDVVLLEGILVFYFKDILEMFDMKLFVDTDADTRLARRVLRDIEERGRDLEHVLHQYTTLVKPAFEEFCLPTKKHADVIIPRGSENTVAISLIVQHLLRNEKGKSRTSSTDSADPHLRQTRRLMTATSLPAGNPFTAHQGTLPRFVIQEGEGILDLNPFQAEMLRRQEDSDFRMRPH